MNNTATKSIAARDAGQTKLTTGQKVTVDIWCCGAAAPATVLAIGKFTVSVDCCKCGQKHDVAPEQVKAAGYTVRRLRRRGNELLDPCKPLHRANTEGEAIAWMTEYVDNRSAAGMRGGEWAVYEDGQEMFNQSYGFGAQFA